MTGNAKYAQRMSDHIGEPVDAACPITRTGGTFAQVGGTVGGVVGVAIGSTGASKDSDIPVGNFAWLGVGATFFAITGASAMGKPKGEVYRIPYADITAAEIREGKLTLRADVDLNDGRHLAFEAKRHGQNKPNAEVLSLLASRWG
jgi:hypothetical protein